MSETRQQYVDNLKSTALDVGDKVVMTGLVAQFSWLSIPGIHAIANFVVSYVLKFAIKETEFGAFFLYIDIRTNQQGRDFYAAAVNNRAIQMNSKATAEEKARAESDFKNKFASFASWSG